MPAQSLHLPWGKDQISLTLPEHWQIAGVHEPAVSARTLDAWDASVRALAQPVEMPPLSALVHKDMQVVIVMDDGSRPTPVSCMLPPVLEELESCGLPREQVLLVPALGLHRPMEAQEIVRRAGVSDLRWEKPDCDDPEKLVYLGVTSRSTPVWINKHVAAADLVISIGCIEPHIIASFGGG